MLCHNLPHVTGNFLLMYLLLTPVHKDTCIYGHYTNDLYFHMYIHVLWNTLLLHVCYDHCYIVYEGFFPVKVQYMGSPFHLQASKVLSHLFTMSLHWTARYGRPPCQFRPHPDSTPVGQNCCRTLIIVFWNVLSNFKEVIYLCIRSKAFVTGAIFCQQNLSIWGSFRE